ncbi:tRNA modification GTPase MnmE [Buchnera aphidicola (Cinara strobi)]|uniref:tRNA modification GTPase MnmE n=1 Tax=Buchnera aphidicola (Cinara strobi) TaxID=1921549 RepID=A0A3B1E9A3_9GAMM|nr:tRNA modification GTPase MnmE [Buchnera aphidicola (Cinara strobi)]
MMFYETIVAPITAMSRSGVGIIRISGPAVLKIINVFFKISMKARFAHYVSFLDFNGDVIDKGIAVFFPSPQSFTGEDVLEFQGHGNPILMDLLIQNIVLIKNVRIAKPGEFSERAFLNQKIDLIQAEAISDLINSQSKLSIEASLRSLSGNFSKKINSIIKKLKEIYSRIEGYINFPDEINNPTILKDIEKYLIQIITLIKNLIDTARKSDFLNKGIKAVIAGPPNVGKSSLFNYLVNQTASIVTDIPGTTRDVIRQTILVNGIRFELLDTAGLRESENIVEIIGIKLAKKNIHSCDHIFLILDITQDQIFNNQLVKKYINNLKDNQSITIIFNKIDLINQTPSVKMIYKKHFCILLSIQKKLGLDFLKNHINKISVKCNNIEGIFLARRRHLLALKKSLKYLISGYKKWNLNSCLEFLSDNLRLAIEELSIITGKLSSEDLLNKIFSDFCIGK